MKLLLSSLSMIALFLSLTGICQAQQELTVTFCNQSELPAKVCWVNEGKFIEYAVLQPGESYEQPTYQGHFWSISNGRQGYGNAATQHRQVFCLTAKRIEPAPTPKPLPPFPVDSLNDKVLRFAGMSLGKRLGNGQCTELAHYALEAAGAAPGRNYVWGTRVASLRDVKPGDIVQFQSVRFDYPNGSSVWSTGPHTAIVVSVEGDNVKILEQNVSGSPVQHGQFNERYKTAGTVTYYRPQAKQGDQFENGPEENEQASWKVRLLNLIK